MTNEVLIISEVDCSTGVQTERPMTQEEIANFEAMRAESQRLQAEEEAAAAARAELKASAKAKLIAGQPLTAEEADTLVI